MPIMRFKNNVPQVYVSESRDFQLFTRVLDFVQNAIKFDIDSITNIIDSDDIPDEYLDRLKSKLGFFSSNMYESNTLRKVLSAFPHILRYKGSEMGVERCVNTFLNIMGIRDGYKLDIHNRTGGSNDHTIRIGISTHIVDTKVLRDMLSYVVPTGYFVEIYFYKSPNNNPTELVFNSRAYTLRDKDYMIISSLRDNDDIDSLKGEYTDEEASVAPFALNTVQLSTVYKPPQDEGETINDEQ